MLSSAVTNRYANALADVVLSSTSDVKPVVAAEQLKSFEAAVNSSSDLRHVLASPAIPVARKRAIIRSLAEKLGLSRVVTNFILVASDHRRAASLRQMIAAFEVLLDERLGFVRADVTSATQLDSQQQESLSGELSKLAGAPVKLQYQIDPALIGGVTAKIGSKVFDGSVRGQLAELRHRLAVGH